MKMVSMFIAVGNSKPGISFRVRHCEFVYTGPYCRGGVAAKGFKPEEFAKKPPQMKETNWYGSCDN